MRRLLAISQERRLSLDLAEMQAIQALLPRRRPRADRRRAGDAGADLVGALRPQDLQGADRLYARCDADGATSSEQRDRQPARRPTSARPPSGRPSPGCARPSWTTPASSPSTSDYRPGLQGGDAQPPLGAGAVRRGQHRRGRRGARHHRRQRAARSPTPTCSASARRICPLEQLPAGVLHPRRIADGVVAGIEDYGNKMGIPTVNGAILYDPGYTANPLVFCGCLGILPHGSHRTEPQPGDLVVVMGGRTGRDGLHGATFSSHGDGPRDGRDRRQRGADRPPHPREAGAGGDPAGARRGAVHAPSPTAARAASPRPSARWAATLGAVVHLERAPLKYPGLRPGRSGSARRRSAWCWPCRPPTGRACRPSAPGWTWRPPPWASSAATAGCASSTASRWWAIWTWRSCTTASRAGS